MSNIKNDMHTTDVLMRIAQVIESRKPEYGVSPQDSYVACLFDKGENSILKKIGEEATEVALACKDGEKDAIVYEVADLWFHSMIALSQHNLSPIDVVDELARREGLSGLEEFASRLNK